MILYVTKQTVDRYKLKMPEELTPQQIYPILRPSTSCAQLITSVLFSTIKESLQPWLPL